MVKTRKYVVKKYFEGIPKRDDFEIVECELPSLQDGDVLLKTEWISVDPYLRLYNKMYPLPFDQFSPQVATIEESKHPEYPVGTKLLTYKGWCEYSIFNMNAPKIDHSGIVRRVPDLNGLSSSLGVGAMGPSGLTAYFGLLEICKPVPGETVVVTVAAGAVGSIVGQIAKIKGCRVIGFTGSDEKVNWLEKELGFDKAFNYKTVDIEKSLKEAAPKGIDCYFDNVGGEMSSIIISQMNNFGRVSICGCVSVYNEELTQLPKATVIQVAAVTKQLKIEGFLCDRWESKFPEAYKELHQWIISGKIKVREHVTEGFDNIFDAFLGLFSGENIGKAVVKL
ncbi:prostaglandin reductase 1-like [Bicyclus anynana]|uniref:Prostaglandin reductase 1 n=1 Tax=Bicyclus anynana TaxID=110368 RepID=A0ABM3LJR6_BICAN|nr:prostaglandin reductase 1-like [Bicyclus anynana]